MTTNRFRKKPFENQFWITIWAIKFNFCFRGIYVNCCNDCASYAVDNCLVLRMVGSILTRIKHHNSFFEFGNGFSANMLIQILVIKQLCPNISTYAPFIAPKVHFIFTYILSRNCQVIHSFWFQRIIVKHVCLLFCIFIFCNSEV